MNIVLLGSPGVGKGTYASRLKKIYGIAHISTGDLFRENIKQNTELGIKAKEYMDKGMLVPDEITIDMLKKRIQEADCKKGFMLDGFPRTLTQAKELEGMTKIDIVLNFVASPEVIIQRLSGRRTCRDCKSIFHILNMKPKQESVCDHCKGELYQRADEMPEVIEKRLRVYNDQTSLLIQYYSEKGLRVEIDGNLHITDTKAHIIKDCQEVLNKLNC